ncbi:2-dehydropantoate 2-reductase [Dissulfurirhabdus thermomarina]|uniref:2-dehydropantoate 2-reductase n=1 Tax=Dissulfurirhabdus thermomarina TaxID=1765737 RepID=A0A6N9TP18_DISTH|nr:2-dehydropantoate 2-reductase [Dissulfurirhabdus thermomarina]NDY43005.1 2-dehydropantoate 2-reductase [Dissulfurirhabdus thermomarina]NMX23826.1 2-dehydropantoate 2-reductase [Dissulfurirhabdus thermomarina]
MHFAIVGAGSIGCLFGAFLSRGGHKVSLVEVRPEIVDAVNRHGIGLLPMGASDPSQIAFHPARAFLDPADISGADAVILAVKSFDTAAAMRGAARLVSDRCPVLSIQTGLGNLEVMERFVDRSAILGGFTYMAATAVAPGRVHHGGTGPTVIGELDGRRTPRVEKIAGALGAAGLETRVDDRVVSRLWHKVIVVSAINAVSAVLKVKNGDLLAHPESVQLMERLVDEGRAAAEAAGVDLLGEDLRALLHETCRATAENLSSMFLDILNGSRTEIDAECGALFRYGRERGLRLLTLQTLSELVTAMEKLGHHGAEGRHG